jgi:hypothetical protein
MDRDKAASVELLQNWMCDVMCECQPLIERKRFMMLSDQSQLAVAAAFNGNGFYDQQLSREDLRQCLLAEMEEYFHYNPKESSQFDREAVLSELRAIPDNDEGYQMRLRLLAAIGYRAEPAPENEHCWTIDADVWQEFIRNLAPDAIYK